MKTRKRSVPLDMLSVEEKGKWISISTHRGQIVISFGPEGCCGDAISYTFDELLEVLRRLNEQNPS